MKTIYLLFIIFAAMTAVSAQKGDTGKAVSGSIQSVVNEDRGRACIVIGSSLPRPRVEKIAFEPRQYSIFLGKGWAADALRARETALSNLISNGTDIVGVDYLEQIGWKNLYSANTYDEKLIDIGGSGFITDLQIQSVLSNMAGDNRLARQGDDMTYIVYLEPALASTLGSYVGRKHYSAYHNAFNLSGTRIRYVVVPYEEDLKTTMRSALIGFISAVTQPDCGLSS